MTPDEIAIRKKLRDDFEHYALRCLKLRTKDGTVEVFKLNKAQGYIHHCLEEQRKKTGRVRAIVLKGRQQGCSTYVGGRYYWKVSHRKGVRAFILTHEAESTSALFEMTERYHDNCPGLVKPSTGASNAKELIFDALDSGYKVGTAGNKSVGRGTTLQFFHGCLAEGTPVITPEGREKAIEDWSPGDLVVTHTGASAPISFISTQEKECFEVAVSHNRKTIISSGEHRYLTRNGWEELSSIKVGDEIAYPVRTITQEVGQLALRLPDATRAQGGGSLEHIPSSIPVTYGLGRILGLYLAEGVIKLQHSGQHSAVCFAVHDREVQRTVKWLYELSDYFASIKVSNRKGCKTSIVNVYGKSFAALVNRLCGRTDAKQLPSEWWRYGDEFVRGLVHGYLAGDGHSSKREYDRRISAPSIREAITYGIRDALAALGYGWAVVNYREGAVRNGRNEQPQWTLRLSGSGVDLLADELEWDMPPRRRPASQTVEISNGYVWLLVKSITPVGIKRVYDFEIDHPDHSYCLPQCVTHNSEVAFWQHSAEHAKGIMQAIPDSPDTEVVLESTANGLGNYFHKQWQLAESGQSEFIAIFVPWFWQDEYRKKVPKDFSVTDHEASLKEIFNLDDEQICFRRSKIIELGAEGDNGESAFKQEYPMTAQEAFQTTGTDSLIKPEPVLRARNTKCLGSGLLKIGVDPARFGDDGTAIIRRRTRAAYHLEVHRKKSTMEVAGIVYTIIKKEKPAQVAIDIGGLGAGVYDRLMELLPEDQHHILAAINFGGTALNPERYKNRRSEMWYEMRDWLSGDLPVMIPDDDSLHADLCGPGYKHDSNSRRVLESKESMRNRGVKSPDGGDSLALTFAEPIDHRTNNHEHELIVADSTTGY